VNKRAAKCVTVLSYFLYDFGCHPFDLPFILILLLFCCYSVVIPNKCIESNKIFSSKSLNVVLLQEFIDDGKGHVAGIRSVTVNWTKDETGRWKMEEVPGSEKVGLIVNGSAQ